MKEKALCDALLGEILQKRYQNQHSNSKFSQEKYKLFGPGEKVKGLFN